MNPIDNKYAPEYVNEMLDFIAWERNDRARHIRESGYAEGWRHVFEAGADGGGDSRILQSIFGANKADVNRVAEREPSPYLFTKRQDAEIHEPGRYLTASQFVNLYSAVAYANSIGLVLNVRLSITWGLLGIEDHSVAANVMRYEFFKHLQNWYENKVPGGRPFVWLYVHEVGRTHGFHTHILTAIPEALRPAFREYVAARLAAVSRVGTPLRKGVFHIEAPPSDPIGRQWRGLKYLAKGVSTKAEVSSVVGTAPFARVAELTPEMLKSPGDIRCAKNCGVSNNIGKERRRKAGFRSLLERGIADVRRLYAGMEYLEYLRQQEADVTDSVARRLIDVELQVNEVAQLERDSAHTNAKVRKKEKAIRRREKGKQKRMGEGIDALRREHEEISQRVKELFGFKA